MITDQLINYADEKVRSLCVKNKTLKIWVYILLGISSLFSLMLIYSFYCGKFNLYKHNLDTQSKKLNELIKNVATNSESNTQLNKIEKTQ